MLKMHSRAAAVAAALFVSALAIGARDATAAAKFSVTPLLLTLPATKLATSLTLGNGGAAAVTVQTELVAWNQDSGEDAYGPATGLIVSPPIFSLAAGSGQVVRLGRLKRGTAPAREFAYRIKLTEVPPQAGETPQAVSTFMQLSLPVFVPPADAKARPAVEFQAHRTTDGSLKLAIANPGAVHDKITHVTVAQDDKVLAERALNYYVLAGARRELALPGALKAAKPGAVRITLQLEGRNRSLNQILAPEPGPKKN
jgi:fimbrial chaperone protein